VQELNALACAVANSFGMLNYRNYDTISQFLAALVNRLSEQETVYLNRIGYALERNCQRRDYATNALGYLTHNGFPDTHLYPGFDEYQPPLGTYNIVYQTDNFLVFGIDAPSTYSPGDVLTFSVLQSGDYSIIGVPVLISAAGIDVTVTPNNSEFTTQITIPSDYIGTLVVSCSLAGVPSNLIYTALEGNIFATTDVGFTPDVALAYNGSYYPLVDYNNDGLVSNSDQLTLLTLLGTDYRLRADKHVQVSVASELYYPGLSGQTIDITVTPAENATRTLDKLHYRVTITDANGSPYNSWEYEYGESEADSQTISAPIEVDFAGPLLVTVVVYEAYNSVAVAELLSQPVELSVSQDYAAPGDVVSLTITPDATNFRGFIIGSVTSFSSSPVVIPINLFVTEDSDPLVIDIEITEDSNYILYMQAVYNPTNKVILNSEIPPNQILPLIEPQLYPAIGYVTYTIGQAQDFTLTLNAGTLPVGSITVVPQPQVPGEIITLASNVQLVSEYTFSTENFTLTGANSLLISIT
jgi:hypothetical protein